MRTEILSRDRWALVAPAVESFGDSMPDPSSQTTFRVLMDGDKLAGVIRVEHLFHFMNEWIAPEYRGGRTGLAFMAEATSGIPVGFSGLWLADRKVPQIARMMGAYEIGEYTAYRKDSLGERA